MTSADHLGTAPPPEDPTTASGWVPLWQIIEQIASAIGDGPESEHYAKTLRYIRQAAVEGRLRIRGRHEIEGAGQEGTIFSEVYTEIPSTYWKHSVISALATGAAFQADRHTNPEKTPYAWGPKGLYEPHCYTGLQLNLEDVSQLTGDGDGAGLLADARSISTKTEPVKFSDVMTLKPGVWGISIDLVKVWNWLRERGRALGRRQAMPQFPKTASILNRLWRDPVWSKVIATGITASIGAALVWYFHTQNPSPPSHPAATAVGPPAQQPSRKYSKADTDRMLAALFELYDTINSNVDAIGRVNGFWLSSGQLMQGKSVKEKIQIATRTRNRVHMIANNIYNTILPQYQYYADDLRLLIQGDELFHRQTVH